MIFYICDIFNSEVFGFCEIFCWFMTFEHICEFFCEITYLFFFERHLIGDVEVGTDWISDHFITNIRSDIKFGVRISGKLAHSYLMMLQRAEIKKMIILQYYIHFCAAAAPTILIMMRKLNYTIFISGYIFSFILFLNGAWHLNIHSHTFYLWNR